LASLLFLYTPTDPCLLHPFVRPPLLLRPQLLTSLLITLLPFSQRKCQPSGNSSTNCLPPPLRAQPSMAHHFLLSSLSARVLLSILSSMGISGKAHSWFESYLTGRSFNVSWQGQLSVPNRFTTGVPQGSF